MTYDHGYENEPIGGGNPYYRCVHCKLSDPQINGRLSTHLDWCEYHLSKENDVQKIVRRAASGRPVPARA